MKCSQPGPLGLALVVLSVIGEASPSHGHSIQITHETVQALYSSKLYEYKQRVLLLLYCCTVILATATKTLPSCKPTDNSEICVPVCGRFFSCRLTVAREDAIVCTQIYALPTSTRRWGVSTAWTQSFQAQACLAESSDARTVIVLLFTPAESSSTARNAVQ